MFFFPFYKTCSNPRLLTVCLPHLFCSVPARNTSQGFPVRNQAVGTSWTALEPVKKAVFHPPLFKRLAQAVLQPHNNPPGRTIDVNNVETHDEDPRDPSDLTPYLPHFKELVNMKKVERHFEQGCLGERRSLQTEKKGREEVSKLVKQVRLSSISSNCSKHWNHCIFISSYTFSTPSSTSNFIS